MATAIPNTIPKDRGELQTLLEQLLGLPSDRVLFQPPENQKMIYPCVVYRLMDIPTVFANNRPYVWSREYELILMSAKPDSGYVKRLVERPGVQFVRPYSYDNINHWVFRVHTRT